MSQMGHSRHFERAPATSGLPSTADISHKAGGPLCGPDERAKRKQPAGAVGLDHRQSMVTLPAAPRGVAPAQGAGRRRSRNEQPECMPRSGTATACGPQPMPPRRFLAPRGHAPSELLPPFFLNGDARFLPAGSERVGQCAYCSTTQNGDRTARLRAAGIRLAGQ
jgi:hypothetical protein